jgi:hypothetical protein
VLPTVAPSSGPSITSSLGPSDSPSLGPSVSQSSKPSRSPTLEPSSSLFDLQDCNTYAEQWLEDLDATCEASALTDTCQCTDARARIDSGQISCGVAQCPDDCEVCKYCLYEIEGCPWATKSPLPSNEPSLSPTVECDVKDFVGLQGAINKDENDEGSGDIKLCSGTIIFNDMIFLDGKQLTFTCPNGYCVLDAESNSGLFYIQGATSNISFDGITFKNGKVSGSFFCKSTINCCAFLKELYRIFYRLSHKLLVIDSFLFSHFCFVIVHLAGWWCHYKR